MNNSLNGIARFDLNYDSCEHLLFKLAKIANLFTTVLGKSLCLKSQFPELI